MVTERLPKGVTALIGSGGKTTLIAHLARKLPGTVIVCTSTHIYPFAEFPLCTEPVEKLPAPRVCMGTPCGNGKLTAPIQSFAELAKLADYVLVEADGANGKPLKAHAAYEPVIPVCANLVIQVLGLSGLGKPIAEAAHRPEIYAQLCHSAVDQKITPAMAAEVVNVENLADVVVLTQGRCGELADLLHVPVICWNP